MRLIRLTTNYPGYLEQFYAARPGLELQSHALQYRTLMDDCFGWADFWTAALATHGYETREVVGNAEHLQKAWAREAGISYAEGNWFREIVAEQVRRFSPDVLFVNDLYHYDCQFVADLRAATPSLRLIVGWCGSPHQEYSRFRACDLVLSNIDVFVDRFLAMGLPAERLRHSFNPDILTKLGATGAGTISFGFCGSLFALKGVHESRVRLLARLVRDCGLEVNADIRLYGYRYRQDVARVVNLASYLLGEARNRVQALLGGLQLGRLPFELVTAVQPPVYGLAMFRRLANTKVVLNTHIDASLKDASNMRLFEATGVGACMLTEHTENLSQLFALDSEVVSYASYEELRDKVRWLLADESSRSAIARAGQQRTLREHRFERRVAEFVEILGRYLRPTPLLERFAPAARRNGDGYH
jgi:spore maturation protein CgeB